MGRIRYGLKNAHYPVVNTDNNGSLTYDTVKELPGAKNMNLEAQGEELTEFADDVIWHSATTNNGYSGTIEFEDTKEADDFLCAVNGWTKNEDGSVSEKSSDKSVEFAFLGQFSLAGEAEGATGKRFKFFRCKASRPSVSGSTNEASKTVATNTVNITCLPRINDDKVKDWCVSSDACYNEWFNSVDKAVAA